MRCWKNKMHERIKKLQPGGINSNKGVQQLKINRIGF